MRTIILVILVATLTMSVNAQYNVEALSTPVDTMYFLNGTLSGNWHYGVVPEARAAYRDNLGAMAMIVYQDSIMIDGHMYCVAYSKQYRNRKTVLLIDWTGEGQYFAELVLVNRQIPNKWISGMLVEPKVHQKYSPEPRYFELYRVENHWLSAKK